MTDASLESLMPMVRRILDGQSDMRDDVREIKSRLGRLGSDVAQMHVFLAVQSVRLDRFSARLERIERRLDVVET